MNVQEGENVNVYPNGGGGGEEVQMFILRVE